LSTLWNKKAKAASLARFADPAYLNRLLRQKDQAQNIISVCPNGAAGGVHDDDRQEIVAPQGGDGRNQRY
jgi:hypothetical protein